MQFDLKRFFHRADEPEQLSFAADLSQEDFGGYSLAGPAQCQLTATPRSEGALLELRVDAAVKAECARCLDPIERTFSFVRSWTVKERDLEQEDFELPHDMQGRLDLNELVFQEIVLEVPPVLLCSSDCSGLCPICGKKKAAGCTCQTAESAAPVDARLSILKQLLN